MLRAGEVIDARLAARRQVLARPSGRRAQRGIAAPVLGGGVGVDELRHGSRAHAASTVGRRARSLYGSTVSSSAKGKQLAEARASSDCEGWAKRWLNSPRRPPATCTQHAVEGLRAVLVRGSGRGRGSDAACARSARRRNAYVCSKPARGVQRRAVSAGRTRPRARPAARRRRRCAPVAP